MQKTRQKHKLSSDIFVHCQLPDTRTARWNVWPIKCFSWTHFTIPILLFYLYFIFIVVDFVPCHFFFALFFPFVLRFFVCVCVLMLTLAHSCVRARHSILFVNSLYAFIFYLSIWKIQTHTHWHSHSHHRHSGRRESNPCFIGTYQHHKNIYNMRL